MRARLLRITSLVDSKYHQGCQVHIVCIIGLGAMKDE